LGGIRVFLGLDSGFNVAKRDDFGQFVIATI
jgi:hypothetical protein